jgi:hypothetical protein
MSRQYDEPEADWQGFSEFDLKKPMAQAFEKRRWAA